MQKQGEISSSELAFTARDESTPIPGMAAYNP